MGYTQSHLEDWIESFLREHKITTPSELKLVKLCRKLNVFVLFDDRESYMLDIAGVHIVGINNRLSYQQQRSDLAHELWHILLEGGDNELMPPHWKQYQESKAGYFSYHFCVPTFMLRQMNLPSDEEAAARLVSDTFKVTFDFAKKRLRIYFNKLNYR
ncbi:ImmA/IrrE family metallo-endopeptidase [Bacillus siamensis]|uniref:ImmA/IrrE family metallo-endopeptidase n=1 Tax=Bacillus TaxID=1386 RepID=UPI0018E5FD95|nr:ImmA/IrrE family metallo-endopeptidase [Bacillus siamensis]QQD82637.1 ImmA/IrrE family metallo-endopeptidase [Bacillus siamensis]